MALYIINQLVENPENADMYQDVDWVILPIVNPDGYEFTHVDVSKYYVLPLALSKFFFNKEKYMKNYELKINLFQICTMT